MSIYARNLTARDFLKFAIQEVLQGPGSSGLSADARYNQAKFAQKCRNIFYTATGGTITNLTVAGVTSQAQIQPWADPTILTDLINTADFLPVAPAALPSQSALFLQMAEYGGEGGSYGLDLFGLTTPNTPQEYQVKWEKNTTFAISGSASPNSHWLHFHPRLIRPYQTFTAIWTLNITTAAANQMLTPQLGFRGLRVLKADNPYGYIKSLTDQQLCDYIRSNDPETFFMEIRTAFSNLPAVDSHLPLSLQTPQLQRPILVMGAASNLLGAQADLFDPSEYYQFTKLDKVIQSGAGNRFYDAPPLNLWAPNTDFRVTSPFYMWPVPHFLDRNATLKVNLYNGLQPNAGGWQQPGATGSGNPDIRITFVCRTV